MSDLNRPCAECAKYDRDGVCSDIGIRITEPGTELPCPKFMARSPAPGSASPPARGPYAGAVIRALAALVHASHDCEGLDPQADRDVWRRQAMDGRREHDAMCLALASAEARAETAEAHAAKAEADMRNAREIAAEHIAAESRERRRAEAAEKEVTQVCQRWTADVSRLVDLFRPLVPDCPPDAEVLPFAAEKFAASESALSALREGVRGLVAKLDEVHASPAYQAVWTIAQLHRGPYRGPQYDDELAALRALLGGGDAGKGEG